MDDDTLIDITDFKTFVAIAIAMMVFGAMIGVGIYITFAGLDISVEKGIQVIIVLFITCGIIAYIPYLYRDYKMKWGAFAEEDEDDEDEDE